MEVEKSPNRESSILLLSSQKRSYNLVAFGVFFVVFFIFRFVLFLELTSIGIVEKKKTYCSIVGNFVCWRCSTTKFGLIVRFRCWKRDCFVLAIT